MSYTLNVSFTPIVPAPPGGYRIQYWAISNPGVITSVFVAGSPYSVSGLPSTQYSGTVEPICGPGVFGQAQPFSAVNSTGGGGVTAAFAYFASCDDGGPVDRLSAQVIFAQPPSVDTPFRVDIVYFTPPESCMGVTHTVSLSGTISAGQTIIIINGCPSGAVYPVGSQVCSAHGVVI